MKSNAQQLEPKGKTNCNSPTVVSKLREMKLVKPFLSHKNQDVTKDFRFMQWTFQDPFKSVVRERSDLKKQGYAEKNFPLDKSKTFMRDDMENTNFLRSQHYSRLSKTATYKALKKSDVRGRFEVDVEEAGDFKRPASKPNDLSGTDRSLMVGSMNEYRTFIKTKNKPQVAARASALSMPREYN